MPQNSGSATNRGFAGDQRDVQPCYLQNDDKIYKEHY